MRLLNESEDQCVTQQSVSCFYLPANNRPKLEGTTTLPSVDDELELSAGQRFLLVVFNLSFLGCCYGCYKLGCKGIADCLGGLIQQVRGSVVRCCDSFSMSIRECCHDGGVRIVSWFHSFRFWLGQRMPHCRHCCNSSTESSQNCRNSCSTICCRRRQQRELCLNSYFLKTIGLNNTSS